MLEPSGPPASAAGTVVPWGTPNPPPDGDSIGEIHTKPSRDRAETVTWWISFPYGHTTARSVLRRRGAQELLAGGRAPRRHAARGQPPGALAREAPRAPAARPLRSPCRAHRGRHRALPRRPADAPARGPARRGARSRRRTRATRDSGGRRFDRSRQHRRAGSALRVPA